MKLISCLLGTANNKSQIVISTLRLKRIFVNCLISCGTKILEASKGNKGNTKLRTQYIKFQINQNLENYLTYVNVRAHRVTLGKFRKNTRQMRVKTGRYQKLEDKDRICLPCDSGEIKSEIHFSMDCSYFSDRMQLFFNFVQKIIPNFQKCNSEKQF